MDDARLDVLGRRRFREQLVDVLGWSARALASVSECGRRAAARPDRGRGMGLAPSRLLGLHRERLGGGASLMPRRKRKAHYQGRKVQAWKRRAPFRRRKVSKEGR